MIVQISPIISKANRIVENCNSRDPYQIADYLNINILERPFKFQLGAYKVIEGNAFIFIKEDLDPVTMQIVLLHEIGHHVLHQTNLGIDAIFNESSLFGINNVMEYEANYFAAQIALPDEEFFEFLELGYNVTQIAQALNTDPNLVALKVKILNQKGFRLNNQEFQSKFLNA